MAFQADGRLAAAADHYQKALQHGPASADVLNNLAVARRQLDLLDAAVLTFRKAVQLDPSHDLARRNLAGASTLQRELEQQLNTSPPSDAAGELHHGIAATMLGRFETMHQHFHRALEQSPGDARRAIRIARIWSTHPNRAARNPQQALIIAQHACRTIEPIDPHHLETLAACHAAVGDYETAANTAAAALERARDDQTQHLTNRLNYAIARYHHAKPYREPVSPPHLPIAQVSL